MNTCSEKKKDGSPCKGRALENGKCFAHQTKDEPKKKEKLYRVRAEDFYHNGLVATNWRADEVREVNRHTLNLLRADAPGNWTVENA